MQETDRVTVPTEDTTVVINGTEADNAGDRSRDRSNGTHDGTSATPSHTLDNSL
jgi:hypothetical protein